MTESWSAPTASTHWQQPAAEPQPLTIKKKFDSAAVASLVLALASIFVWYVPAVVALFLAQGAKRNIKAEPQARKGKELATAAQLISLFTIAITTAIVAAIAVI